jgi:hypothetical protein
MRRFYPAKLLEVYGTNTIDVEVDLGFNTFTRQRIRLFGVSSAGKDAVARQVLLELCQGITIIVEPIITKRAKLGRVLGWAYVPSEETDEIGLNINQTLVDQGLALHFEPPESDDEDD